ncbi:MAG: ribosome maturation factor RimM [Synechococcales bacterium]|nr:ribosome maturation factor RimM [Synechococcales bacterium]
MVGWLEIGRIVAPQGLRGEMRIYPSSDFPERFLEAGLRWLQCPGETDPQPMQLTSGRFVEGKGLYVITLEGISSREQVEALRGCWLLVPESDRPPLEEGEYHVADLIGLAVYDQASNALVGTVRDVLSAGNDLLEVELAIAPPDQNPEAEPSTSQKQIKRTKGNRKPPTVLIPFVEEIVPVVDLQQRRIAIAPPPGLIELDQFQ